MSPLISLIEKQDEDFIEECACEFICWEYDVQYQFAKSFFKSYSNMISYLSLRVAMMGVRSMSDGSLWFCPYGCHRVDK